MIKILVIDDDKFEREGVIYLLNKLFGKLGDRQDYYIKDIRNGRIALELLEKEYFHIVITDIKMPIMDGMVFLERAIQIRDDITYIIYSGYSDFEYAKKAMHLNVMDFLVKPVKETEFNEVMKQAILKVNIKFKEKMRYKLLSLYYKKEPLYKVKSDILCNIKGKLVYIPFDKRNLESYTESLERLGENNIIVNLEEKGKMMWLCGSCSKEDNIENNIRYIFAGLEGAFIVSKKISSIDDLESQYLQILDMGNRIAINERFTVLHYKDIKDISMRQEKSIPFFDGDIFNVLCFLKENKFFTIDMKKDLIRCIKEEIDIFDIERLEKIILNSKYISDIEEYFKDYNNNEVVIKVKNYINKNYMNDISVGDIAESIFLNPGYLCTLFKKETGLTIINYIMEYRIRKSMELLKIRELKISDISIRVGYKNISYFNSIFRQKTGFTPNQYRKRIYEN